jgi:hypothetical protein
MKIRRLLAGAAITATALVTIAPAAGASSAGTNPKATEAKVIGSVMIDPENPGVAYVLAQYRCTVADPVNDPSHLWVSVKQSADGAFDPELSEEGSGFGGTAARWEDSHRNPVDCDGRTHVDRFTVDQLEGKESYGTLTKGVAWVQFCLFDDTTPKGDGQTDFGQPVSSMVWKHVV